MDDDIVDSRRDGRLIDTPASKSDDLDAPSKVKPLLCQTPAHLLLHIYLYYSGGRTVRGLADRPDRGVSDPSPGGPYDHLRL